MLAEAHGAAEVLVAVASFDAPVAIAPLGYQADDRMPRVGVDFRGVGVVQTDDVASEVDHRGVQSVADAEVRHVVFPGEARGAYLALEAALAEAAGNEDGMHIGQCAAAVLFQFFGVDVAHDHIGAVLDAGMGDRFGKRLVGVQQVQIFADDGDFRGALRVRQGVGHSLPLPQIGGGAAEAEFLDHDVVQHLLVQHPRHLVDGGRVLQRNDGATFDVGKQRDLVAHLDAERLFGAADQHIRLQADGAQFLHRVLRWFGLDLAGHGQFRHQREMDEQRIASAHFQA